MLRLYSKNISTLDIIYLFFELVPTFFSYFFLITSVYITFIINKLLQQARMKYQKQYLKIYARELRLNATEAEKRLWSRIRNDQLLGFRFNRQKVILNYIVDFYCAKAKLIIELDGGQHYQTEHQKKDRIRDNKLSTLGLTVLRFDNIRVMTALDDVVEEM